MPVTLVPLDDRPCCADFPPRVAALAGLELNLPPYEWLGHFHEPGRVDSLLEWLPAQPEPWVVSLDMLIFGGLVASRRPELGLTQALARFEQFERLAAGREVLAFQSILRTAPTQTSQAQVEQAERLVELGVVSVRAQAGDARAVRRAAELEAQLSPAVVAAYHLLRERNYSLNQVAVGWAQRSGQTLLLGIDDSKTAGWNVLEARQLQEQIERTGARATIAPGTDESALLLLARQIGPEAVQPVWWGSPAVVGRYEDRSLAEVLAAQAAAAGVELRADAERQLFLWAPEGEQREAADATGGTLPPEFLPALRSALERGPVAVADLRYANGGDPVLAEGLLESGLAAGLTAYAGWNTAGNALGTALSALAVAREGHDDARQTFLLERFADDYLYQSVVRGELRAELGHPGLNLSGPECARLTDALQRRMGPEIERMARQLGRPDLRCRLALPWHRLFEVAVTKETGSPSA